MSGRSTVLSVLITGDAKGLRKAFGEAGDDADKAGGKMSGLGKASALAGVAMGGMALAALPGLKNLGAELKVMGDKAATVFGDQLEPMKAWAAENNRSLGLSKQATLDLATSMSDLLIPMGFTRDAAAEQSRTMIGAAGALSAWSKGKFSAAEVSDIMTKAILGETDGLKALGISISAADVDARLLAKGQKELTGEALAQAKAIATQELIMEKSADAQKAWADGTMDATKAQNEAKAKAEEMHATLALALQPAFAALTDLIVGVVIPGVEALTGFFSEHKVVAGLVALAVVGLAAGMLILSINTALAAETGAVYAAKTVITAAATGAWTAAQWLLNAALSANPVMLVVIAIAALVAGVVLAYQHFDWFRGIVDGAWQVLQTGFHWVADNWPLLLAILTGPIGLAVLAIVKYWDDIKAGFAAVKDWIVGLGGALKDAIVWPFEQAFAFVKEIYDKTIGPMVDAIGAIGNVAGSVGGAAKGAAGKVGGLFHAEGGIFNSPTLGIIGEAGPEAVIPLSRMGTMGGTTINVTVVAPVGASPAAVGRELRRYLNEYERAGGRP